MKVKIKSEKMLRELFEKEGYYRGSYSDGWQAPDIHVFFNNDMFKFCDVLIPIEPARTSDYDFQSCSGTNWSWKKEWTVQMSDLHMTEFDV